MTISFQETPVAAWNLSLSQKHDFLNIHIARVPVTSTQEEIMELRDEVFSSVGAEDGTQAGIFRLIWTMLNSTGKKKISWK